MALLVWTSMVSLFLLLWSQGCGKFFLNAVVSPAAAKSRHRFRCTHGAAEAAPLQNKIKTWLAAASFIAHALDEAGYVHYGSSHGAVADFLRAVVGADAHGIEA